jgi:hypothetical protein
MAKKDMLTYKEYAEMTYREPHRELQHMVSQARRLSTVFNASARLRLLPALQAMHDKVCAAGTAPGIQPE